MARVILARNAKAALSQTRIARLQYDMSESTEEIRAFWRRFERALDRLPGAVGIAAGEMRAGERKPDFLRRQCLPLRGRQRSMQGVARRCRTPFVDFLLRDLEERTGVVGQRRENLFVDGARVSATPAVLVLGREREGVLKRELHLVWVRSDRNPGGRRQQPARRWVMLRPPTGSRCVPTRV